MKKTEINFLETAKRLFSKPTSKRKRLGKFFIYLFIFILVLGGIFSFDLIFIKGGSNRLEKIPILGRLAHLTEGSYKELKGEEAERINILILGMGGKYYEGGYLTDTIILASLNLNNKKVALLSIPRDMVVPIPGYGWRKINNASAFAEIKEPGTGGLAASQMVSKVFDLPVHYYTRIDFDGFEKILDDFGGVDVYVENTLDDYRYPIRGKEDVWPIEERYEHLHIEKGWQHMNGELALKYARSRYALGEEGSDFARAKRQQKILAAFKNKAFSFLTLLNPGRIKSVIDTLENNFDTNFEIWEIIRLARLSREFDTKNIIHQVLDESPDGFLVSSLTNGAYILEPRTGNFSEIQELAKNIFLTQPPRKNSQTSKEEESVIEIQNGTKTNGLAAIWSNKLKGLGYKIIKIGNAETQDHEKTIIYDLTRGTKPLTRKSLKEKFNATVMMGVPHWLASRSDEMSDLPSPTTKADFLIILGTDLSL